MAITKNEEDRLVTLYQQGYSAENAWMTVFPHSVRRGARGHATRILKRLGVTMRTPVERTIAGNNQRRLGNPARPVIIIKDGVQHAARIRGGIYRVINRGGAVDGRYVITTVCGLKLKGCAVLYGDPGCIECLATIKAANRRA